MKKHKAVIEERPDGWFSAMCLERGSDCLVWAATHPSYDLLFGDRAVDRAVVSLGVFCPYEHEHA